MIFVTIMLLQRSVTFYFKFVLQNYLKFNAITQLVQCKMIVTLLAVSCETSELFYDYRASLFHLLISFFSDSDSIIWQVDNVQAIEELNATS